MLLICPSKERAKELADRYQMKRLPQTLFPFYRGEKVQLLLCPNTPIELAAATSWALSTQVDLEKQSPCLFLGEASHPLLTEESPRLIHQVKDPTDSSYSYYPSFIIDLPCATETLYTSPQSESSTHTGFTDPLAAAFFRTIPPFRDLEWAHALLTPCSAGKNSTPVALNAVFPLIDDLIAAFAKLRQEIPLTIDLETLAPFLERWHFSVSQQHQLRHLLQRWTALAERSEPWSALWDSFYQFKASKDLIQGIERLVDHIPIHLTPTLTGPADV